MCVEARVLRVQRGRQLALDAVVRLVEGHGLLEGLERVAIVALLAPQLVCDPLVEELPVARHQGLDAQVGVHIVDEVEGPADLELGLDHHLVTLLRARVEDRQQLAHLLLAHLAPPPLRMQLGVDEVLWLRALQRGSASGVSSVRGVEWR